MRHRNTKSILNKPADQRKALMRNLLTSLFLYGKVKTTGAKAKALVTAADKLIATAKRQSEEFNTIRELKKVLFTEESSKKALQYIKQSKKKSGFTRPVKLKFRDGDSAVVVQVELIQEES